MRVLSKKQIWAVGSLALAAATLTPAAAWAVVPVVQPPLAVTPILINGAAGEQAEPSVSGDWMVYSHEFALIRYYQFSTGIDAAIPLGPSLRDSMPNISGSRITFRRVTQGKSAIMVFDAAVGGEPMEIDPSPAANRHFSAIGGGTVAYIDLGIHPKGELVIHDLATSTSIPVTSDDAYDFHPSVSPDGSVVTWMQCLDVGFVNCDIFQAVRVGDVWHVSLTTTSSRQDYGPDTNGTVVAYESHSNNYSDVYWRPLAGGPEVRLEWAGLDRWVRIAGDFITFSSQPSSLEIGKVFVYDVPNNRLFQITDAPSSFDFLSDIAVLPDGSLRVVWMRADGLETDIWGATFRLPNLAPTLAHSAEPGYGTDGVNPDSGPTATTFTYKVVYADPDDEAPSYVAVCIDGTCHAMAVDATAAASLQDGDYRNGEQYSFATTLAAGTHSHHFEASDGIDTARLPAAGALTGPSVSDVPPVLHVPATITVNATSPSGAVVTFVVTATDPVDPNPVVVCVPASGSTFAVGTTIVSCTATSVSGGQSAASFDIVVKGPAGQITDLIALVMSFNLKQGIENSLDAKLQNVLDALNAAGTGDTATACNKLNAFVNEVQAQSGKAITAAQAGQLIVATNQVKAALACP